MYIFIAIFGFLFIKCMKHVKKIKLHSKRTTDMKKELYDEQLKHLHKKEIDTLKTIVIELSEALIIQSSGSTKEKLNKLLSELKHITYIDDANRLINDDRISRIDSDINPLYKEQEMTIRNI